MRGLLRYTSIPSYNPSLHMNVGSNYVKPFAKNTYIALADIEQRRLKRKTKSKEGNQRALSTIVPPSVASL